MAERDDSSFRPDIEGVRGLAILLVIAFHAGIPGISGGYIGVDVFYVLSGYLITGLMVVEIEKSGRLGLVKFYARRARRLLPAAALVLIVTLLLAVMLYSPIEMLHLGRTAQSVALYVSNFWFARNSIDYLGPNADVDPLLHTWSLGVEEQFYLIWPVMVMALMWFGARRLSGRRVLAIGIITVTVGTFALCVYLTRRIQPWAFYTSPPRFWEFGVGALAAITPLEVGRRFMKSEAYAAACLALIVVPAVVFDSMTRFPGVAAAAPVLGTAGLLRAQSSTLVNRLLTLPVMLWIGRQSYSWYLWHWPLVVFAAVVWPHPPLLLTVGAAMLALACSVVTYKTLEHPMRSSGYLRSRPRLSIALGLSLALIGVGAGQGLRWYAEELSTGAVQRRLAAAKVDVPRIYKDGCTVEFLDVKPKHECVYGDVASTNTVVLFGDSHAAQWFPAVDQVALAKHWRLIVRIKASCPVPWLPRLYSDRLHRTYAECSKWRDNTVAEIIGMRPAVVIMSSSTAYVSDSGDGLRVTAEDWEAGLRRTTAGLDAASIAHVWITDTPRPGFDVPICLSRADAAWIGRSDCTFERSGSLNPVARRAEAAVSSGLLLDLNDQICPTDRCAVERDGIVVYSDSNHLSAGFDSTLAPVLLDQLRALNL